MSFLLIVSILIRLAAILWAIAWSIILLRRLKNWRIVFLTVLLVLMSLRECLTLFGGPGNGLMPIISGAAQQPGIVLSLALFIAVPILARMFIQSKDAEEALRNSETKFRVLAETARSAIIIAQESRLVYANAFAEELSGYSRKELLSIDPTDIVHPYFREAVRSAISAASFASGPSRSELKIAGKGGKEVWLDLTTSPMEFEGKAAILGTAFDITENKRAEAELRKMQSRMRHVLLYCPATIYLLRIQGENFISEWFSESFTRLTGYEREEVSFEGWWVKHIHPEDRDAVLASIARLFTDDRLGLEYRFQRKNGDYFWVHDELSLLRDDSGEPMEAIGTWLDVTEQREAERALRASEERYRDLVENAHDIIYSHDLQGNYTSINKAVERITGYTREEALTRNVVNTVASEDLKLAHQMIAAKLAGQKETVYDLDIMAKDGRHITVEVNTRLVLENGIPVGIQGIARDVTERKRAEEALRRVEERFRRYFELGLIGMATTSPDKGFIEVNERICEILGYERNELVQLSWAELTHPEDLLLDTSNFNKVLNGDFDRYSIDKRFIRKDGTVIHASISVNCVRRPDRSVEYFIALLEDITERKQAEQALRESQAHLQAILDNCPAMVFMKDKDGRYLKVNRKFETTHNMTAESILGKTDEQIFPLGIAKAYRASDNRVMYERRPSEFEEQVTYAEPKTFIVQKFPLQDENGNVYAVGGISTDITSRKTIEDDLRKQKEILQKIFDHIPVMIRFLDENGDIKLVNREWERTLGWSMEDATSNKVDVFSELYPDKDYRKHVLSFIAAATGEFAEFKTTTKEGRVIDTTFANVRLEDGTNIGIGRDITERQQSRVLLRRQTAQLEALRELGLEISAESDLSKVLELVTMRAAELLDASHCSTYIKDRDEPKLNLAASIDEKFVGFQMSLSEGLAGRAFSTGNSFAVSDYSDWIGRSSMFKNEQFGPALATPFKWQQIPIGALSLARKRGKRPFTPEDIHLIEQLAAVGAIAIHQATLFDEVKSGRRRLQILSHRLIEAQEAERKRLARDLHDQIGQALTAVQISIQDLASNTNSSKARKIHECLATIDDAIQQVHDLSLDLRPSLLDDLGLVAALRWYLNRLASRSGLRPVFHAVVRETRLPPQLETTCFRIAQEALTNIVRHASAKTVSVQVKQVDSTLQLQVRDDGVGFDVPGAIGRAGLEASLGLQGMQERAAALGGDVIFTSKPGAGADVFVSFPLGHRLP